MRIQERYEVTPSQKTSEFTHQLMLEDNGAGIGANLIPGKMASEAGYLTNEQSDDTGSGLDWIGWEDLLRNEYSNNIQHTMSKFDEREVSIESINEDKPLMSNPAISTEIIK